MDTIKQKINSDLIAAMRAGETQKRDTLRILSSAIKDEEIKKQKREQGLSEEETIEVVARSIKQRRDSISEYEKANRPELAQVEKDEIAIIEKYLPEQLSEEEVQKIIRAIIAEVGATGKSDFGKVMGVAMQKMKGKTNGDLVKRITEQELS